MKLTRLTLANFRGFEQIDICFEPDVTIIAGVNGVGKSAILQAIATTLSHSLPRFTSSGESPLLLSDTDVKNGKSATIVTTIMDLDNATVHTDINRVAPLDLEKVNAYTARRDELRFAIRTTTKNSNEQNEIDDQLRQIELALAEISDVATVRVLPSSTAMQSDAYVTKAKEQANQPLAILYSTARFLSRLPPVLSKETKIGMAAAYASSLNQIEVSLTHFAYWYRALTENTIRTPELGIKLLGQLENALEIFLPGVSNLKLDQKPRPRFSLKKDNSRFYLEQLSDGERGLLALVFDLTRRLAIANPDSDNPIAEGVALVMIDEIELHLHPKWQRNVVRRLREVFANCQFLITTHSPQVIGQVKAKQLRLLHTGEAGRVSLVPVAQSFGMDSSWILQNIMNVPARDYEMEQRLYAIFEAIDDGDYAKARTDAEALRNEIGDFPDLQEALGLLDRLQMLE